MPKISVVMSVYNGEKYMRESIESILSQSEKDFEYIIIDDGSTDTSLKIINEFQKKDPRIKVLSRKNKGLVYSLNEGLQLAQGEYIARMDADDISHIDRFERQIKYMEEENLVVCGSFAEKIDTLGQKVGEMTYPPSSVTIKSFALLHNPFIHPSIIFKKDSIEKVGGYKAFFRHIEDYELWTRLIYRYKTGNIPLTLLQYRVHDEQITQKKHFSMVSMGIFVRILAAYRFLIRL